MKGVIEEDDELVKNLGWTHQEFTKHLQTIILMVKDVTSWKIIEYPFSRKKKKYSILSEKFKSTLKITKKIYVSSQYSLFYNEETKNPKFNCCWNEEYLIENMQNGFFFFFIYFYI